jgi:hypothetical protein
MSRLAKAMIAYLALGALAFATLGDFRIRSLTLLILGLFAFKSWIRRNDVLVNDVLVNDVLANDALANDVPHEGTLREDVDEAK